MTMFPSIQRSIQSCSRSTDRSGRSPSSTTSAGSRLPRLYHRGASNWQRRSLTVPKSSEGSRGIQSRRRIRSLVPTRAQSTGRTRRSALSTTSPGKPPEEEVTYIKQNGKSCRTVFKAPSSLEDRESQHEGVTRQSRFIKPLPNDRWIRRQYDYNGTIGEGSFSIVTRCYNRKNGTYCALKIIDRENLSDKFYYVENEADLLSRFTHPNILKLLEAYKTPVEYFLVTEYVENGDLFDAVKQVGSFNESTTADMVSDVASALNYLHSHSIVHRDVKPENLLLTNHYRVKLGDFGLACRVLGPLYRVCGTPTYVAPEILSEKGYGVAVDCWSLGIIMYILLCGYAPFRHNNRDELFQLIQHGRFQFDGPVWNDVSQGAKALLSRLLNIDPEKRINASQVLRDPFIKIRCSTNER